jgi:hypothetical protein
MGESEIKGKERGKRTKGTKTKERIQVKWKREAHIQSNHNYKSLLEGN